MSAPTREEVIKLMIEMDKDYPEKLHEYLKAQLKEDIWHRVWFGDENSKPVGILPDNPFIKPKKGDND